MAGRPRPRLQQTRLPNPGDCVDEAVDCKRETCFSFGEKMETNRNHLFILPTGSNTNISPSVFMGIYYILLFSEILFSKLLALFLHVTNFYFYNRSASL